jgi:hypothetical protein
MTRLVLDILTSGPRAVRDLEDAGLGETVEKMIAAGQITRYGAQFGRTTIFYVRAS